MLQHRPSILYWIVTSNAAFGEIGMGLLRAIEPWTQWIAGWGFDMSKGEPDFSPEEILRKVRILVGDPKLEIESRQHFSLVREPGICTGLFQGAGVLRR
jgi:2,4-dichlorophenol 6-monooxygenase